MTRYSNGRIPKSALVYLGGEHWLTTGTAHRWNALVADVRANEGVTLTITPGPNAYRDHAQQVKARKDACAKGRCNDASVAGKSSHGGDYRGRDSMAIDVSNWSALGRTKFYAYARKHGFEPGFFDWEPWHIIDWDPWWSPAPAGGGSTDKPAENANTTEKDEDEMAMKGAVIKRASGPSTYVLFNEVSGFYVAHSGVEASYNNNIARNWGTGSWPEITEKHWIVLKTALDAVRTTTLGGSVDVDLTGDKTA